jgi:hypothetical protein
MPQNVKPYPASVCCRDMRSEHKFPCMVGQLAHWKYGRGYALYEKSELIFRHFRRALRESRWHHVDVMSV